jgi:ketosteroid isomerase-like protein
MGNADLQAAINRAADAGRGFLNGNPDAFTRLWSKAEDVTIFGGFGGIVEQGYDAVINRMAWASARFRSGELRYEPIASGGSGDLGYAIGVERGHVTVAGQDKPGEMVLRVTHLFRREQGEWRLLHRHADAVTTVIPPTALLVQTSGTDE